MHDVDAAVALTRAPAPGGAARRVARRVMGGDSQRADTDDLAVGDGAHAGNGRKRVRLSTKRDLRVVVVRQPAAQRAGPGLAVHHLGAAEALERRDAADVVVVLVRGGYQPDVRRI